MKKAILSVIFIFFAHPVMAAMPGIVETISTGRGSASVVVDEKGDRVFIANAYDKNVAVIERVEVTVKGKKKKTHKLNKKKIQSKARMLDINMGANALVYNQETDHLYLPDRDYSFIIMDAKTGKHIKSVPNVKGENGWMSAVHLDNGVKEIIALDWYGFIQFYDMDGRKKREVDTGLRGIKNFSVTKDGLRLYLTKANEVVEINTRSGAIMRRFEIPTSGVPLIDDATGIIYVGGRGEDGKRRIYKILDRDYITSDDMGYVEHMGFGMALNPNTRHIFAPSVDDTVAVLDADNLNILGYIKVGKAPRSIAVNTKTNMVYVACSQDGKIVVIKDEK